MKDLAGKTAFVTGGASGIGLAIATALAQAGVKVMLCDIEQEALDRALKGLRATNADASGVQADVSLKSELEAAAQRTLEVYGEVNILVNNAGVGGGGGYGAWADNDWNWAIGVNLMGVIWGVEIFGPLIERAGKGGHIVNTASIAGLSSATGSAYNVTKYGVVGFTEGLRSELAPRGIGVSVLCPGFVRTNITSSNRNRPNRFRGAQARGPITREADWVRTRVETGIDPRYVGELVREAIVGDWPYIFTDNEFERFIEARFANIRAGFDRIRGRDPTLGEG